MDGAAEKAMDEEIRLGQEMPDQKPGANVPKAHLYSYQGF
jgi:hypothetical protein